MNQRSVREHFNLLLTKFKRKNSAELKALGIEVDDLTPTESLLEQILCKIEELEAELEAENEVRNKKSEKERLRALEKKNDKQNKGKKLKLI